jgi:arsenate reductase
MKNVLVICTGNSCRSQIAQAYLEIYSNPTKFKIYSAGVQTHGVHPNTIATMLEDGIDISHYTSNSVKEYIKVPFKYVLTVCDNAHKKCPYFPSSSIKLHNGFTDPTLATGTPEYIMQQYATVRQEIKTYIQQFVVEQNLV